jgi:photosystem II stability/assembly factor-like uncharacterized protein
LKQVHNIIRPHLPENTILESLIRRFSGRRARPFLFVLSLTALSVMAPLAAAILNHLHHPSPKALRSGPEKQTRFLEAYGKLPLSFEPNQAKADPDVKFISRGAGYSLSLTATDAVLRLRRPSPDTRPQVDILASTGPSPQSSDLPATVLRITLVGADSHAGIEGADRLPGKSHYFIGNDPKNWLTNVPQFARVRYHRLYHGIDLLYRGNQRRLEFDFELAPGADPNQIQLGFDGIDSLHIDPQGDLVLSTPGGEIRQHKPLVYQTIAGTKKETDGRYVINDCYRVGFKLARYDTTQPLVIDPVLSYSTYLGGFGSNDYGSGIAVDSTGNAYVTGATYSRDFPTTGGAYRRTYPGHLAVFVAKLNPAGTTLLYSTYVGGTDNTNFGRAVAIDIAGNAYITGYTSASDFPTTAGVIQSAKNGPPADAFVTKLNNTGSSLLYSTYLGGSNADLSYGIAVDAIGYASVAGYTYSTDFPVANAFQASNGGSCDAFVARINPAGTTLVFSTYLGGTSSDYACAVACNPAGSTYVTGYTSSNPFPTTPGAFQTVYPGGTSAYVTRFGTNGAVNYSTYLNRGSGYGIAVDSAANAYVTGYTSYGNLATENAFQKVYGASDDAFVARLNPAGSALVYYTYLGGAGSDYGQSIAVDPFGDAHVTGYTLSFDLPTANAVQPSSAALYGVYRTTDGASSWSPGNTGFPPASTNTLAVDPVSSTIVYAGANYGEVGAYKSVDGGVSWNPAGNSPLAITAFAINPSNTATIYAGSTCSGVYQSTDGGASWAARNDGLLDTCVQALVISPSSPTTLYAGTSSGMFKTADAGNNWNAVNTNLPASRSIYGLAIDPTSSNIVYAPINYAGIFKTTDGGSTWTAANNGLPQNPYFFSLALDPAGPATLYGSTSHGLYKTTDGANNWNFITHFNANQIVIDPTNSATLYAISGGVSRSTDGGMSWDNASAGIVRPILSALAISASNPATLYARLSVQADAFVARFDPSGSFLYSSTYLGGNSHDYGYGIAADPAGNSYVTGYTASSNFPTRAGSFQPTSVGYDAFVVKITRALRLPGDFDAGGKINIAVYRPGTGVWYTLSTLIPGAFSSTQWGAAGDLVVHGDYDGDGKTDIAVWRPGSGVWYVLHSNPPGTYTTQQ